MPSRVCSLLVAVALAASVLTSCSSSEQAVCDYSETTESAARIWNEVALDAIRRDFPAPTVHARNLFHLSVVNWDAWAAWDPVASGHLVQATRNDAAAVDALRADAISFGAHRLLTHRYERAVGAEITLAQIDDTLARWCDVDAGTGADAEGTAAELGIAIADEVIAVSRDDGSNEAANYDDFSYASVNPPLVVDEPGATMVDPARWQPLSLATFVTQNGIPQPAGAQTFIGPSWGSVRPFAIEPDPTGQGLPVDIGPPPTLESDPEAWFEGILDVVSLSRDLDPAFSPDADRLRVIAEFWADGPDSETPPGHWNTIANDVGDALEADGSDLVVGSRTVADRLEWDVKTHLAVNGANHDAAIAGWGTKAVHDYARPISMIRWAAEQGQSTDPAQSNFDSAGLPLIPDLIEVISTESSAVGERHEHLSDHVGEIALLAWSGPPEDPSEHAGVAWIRAVEWMPYQRPDFVSPAFAAYVSGHSAFSRASAEVLEEVTGSPAFPRGPFVHEVPAGELIHEYGPDEAVVLEWNTFREAADEAGFSRRAGGIHVPADDLAGRALGATVAVEAWARAQELYGHE